MEDAVVAKAIAQAMERVLAVVKGRAPTTAREVIGVVCSEGLGESEARRALHVLVDRGDLKVTVDWKVKVR